MSSPKKFDVFGVGNAIVDTLAQVDDAFIEDLKIAKGGMSLMDANAQATVLEKLEGMPLRLASGGSAANTMVAIAQSGGTGVYSGKVTADTNGQFYKHDMEEAGIGFHVPAAPEASLPTGTCVVLTTPDAERTMCTHLGVSTTLSKTEIDTDLLDQCKYSYIEGYLWDSEQPRAACMEAFEQSKKLGVTTAFTFSDAFLIDRFADQFKDVVSEYCDIVFCNADEARKYFDVDDLEECAKRMGQQCDLAFMTDGATGCHVIQNGNVSLVEGFDVKAIDTNGAGDSFAGGVLYGLANGLTPEKAAKWGNYVASRVVSVIGPRLHTSIADRVAATVA